MKSQYSIYFIAILNVVCCYPSPSESEQYQKLFSTSESITPCDSTQENHFPEVSYPTKMLDTIELYFYRAADHDDILAPFSSDVKDAYNSLDGVRKCNDAHLSLPSSSEETVDIEALEDDNCKSIVEGHEDVHSALNVKGDDDITSESNVENAEDVTIVEDRAEDDISELNVEGAEDVTTKSKAEVLDEPYEAINELNIEVPKESENTINKINVEEFEDGTSESSTEEAEHTLSGSTAAAETSENMKTASNIEISNIEPENIRTASSETTLSIECQHSNATV